MSEDFEAERLFRSEADLRPDVSGDGGESVARNDGFWTTRERAIQEMRDERAEMRRELLRQWARAHYGACSFEDCYTGHVCSWPLPACVADATEAEIQEAARER